MTTLNNLCLIAVLFMANINICFGAVCQSEQCSVAFKSRGCYKDSSNRVLPNYIYNERDPTVSNYGNRKIDWWHWEDYLAGFACRCATKAKALGYDVFAVQFYGECWAGKSNTVNYQSLGKSEDCIGDFYKKCGNLDRYCTGKQWTNFVYEIIDNTCSLQFERVGCYRDNHESPRPLGDYVLNDRDPTANESWSGQSIDWRNWDVYLPEFACRCAKKAQEKGATYFGLQYYGECWTSSTGSETYYIDGTDDSSCKNNCYKKCRERHAEICMGEGFSNYVYRIKSADEPACDIGIESIGCYKENTDDRALQTELLNTDPGNENFYGEMPVVVGQWNAFFPGFLCECAQKAKRKGWMYFGVSNGTCYSDATSENYNRHGAASACGEGSINNACAAGSKLCSGSDTNTNYIYKISTSSSKRKRSFIPAKDPFMKRYKYLGI